MEKVKKSVSDMEENSKARLLDGFYKCTDNSFEHWEVQGDKIDLRDTLDCYDPRPVMEYGDFGGFNINIAIGALSHLKSECPMYIFGPRAVSPGPWVQHGTSGQAGLGTFLSAVCPN